MAVLDDFSEAQAIEAARDEQAERHKAWQERQREAQQRAVLAIRIIRTVRAKALGGVTRRQLQEKLGREAGDDAWLALLRDVDEQVHAALGARGLAWDDCDFRLVS